MNSSANITQAVILAAGFGTRLRPLTDNIPKVMVPLVGKPLLQRHIEQLKKHGITDLYINLHYLPEVIMDYFGDGSAFGVNITYAIESPDILGTAGGIKNFKDALKDHFFVIYGDILSLVDYTKMAEHYLRQDNPVGMEIVGDTLHPADSDLVTLDERGRFAFIHKKPHAQIPDQYRSMRALFLLSKDILDHIPDGYAELDHQVLPNVIEKGLHVYGFETADYLKDVGTLERYAAAEQYLIDLEGGNG